MIEIFFKFLFYRNRHITNMFPKAGCLSQIQHYLAISLNRKNQYIHFITQNKKHEGELCF